MYLLLFTFILHPPQELLPLCTFCCSPLYYTHLKSFFLCVPSAVHLYITPTSGASSSVYLLLFTFILHPPQELLPLFTFCCSPLYYTHLRSFYLCVPSAVHLYITPTSGASSSVYLLLFTFILHPPQELLPLFTFCCSLLYYTHLRSFFLCVPSAVHLYITLTSGASSSVYLLLFTLILHPPQELLPLCTFCCSPLYHTHLRSVSYFNSYSDDHDYCRF